MKPRTHHFRFFAEILTEGVLRLISSVTRRRLFALRGILVLSLLCPIIARARELSRDEFFVVATKNLLSGGVSLLGTPSVNDVGDIVARVTTTGGTEHRVFLFSAQTNNPPAGNTASIIARSSVNTLGSLPLINNNKSVVSYHSFTAGNQNILRMDFDSGASTYIGVPIARANVTQVQPFSFLSPIAGLDDASPANVHFYGERTPLSGPANRRIYRSNDEVTAPATETPIASYPDAFSAIDAYVASSPNAKTVYRGTKSGQAGIYKNDGNLPVATPSLGFTTTGTRPNINSLDTVGFYGVYENVTPALPGVFLWLNGEASPRFAGNLATRATSADILRPSGLVPSAYSTVDRIALNDFNQVAFLGSDDAGHPSIFTTALGRTRKLVSVGDTIRSPRNNALVAITSLALFNGIARKGQVTFFANTSDGDQMTILANRTYNQRSTLYSPIAPSYRGTQYLLRSVPGSGHAENPEKTIGWVGCNLTSTANIVNSFGANTSPIEFQKWLIEHRNPFISTKNDFEESAVEWFSFHLFGQGKASSIVRYRGMHSTANGPNMAKIKSELRAGRPVKLRVPSSSRYGHYIIAYGIIDPSKSDAQIGAGEILIADPGKHADFTLAEYGEIVRPQASPMTYNQVYGANWIEDQNAAKGQRRVYLYDIAPAPILIASAHSPIHVIITDSLGRRAGHSDDTGTLREIPGSDYFEEISYDNLHEAGETSEAAWGTTNPVKRVIVNGAVSGAFTLDIFGTGSGSYTVSILGNGGVSSDVQLVSGSINLGETRTINFNLGRARPEFLNPPLIAGGQISWTVIGDPSQTITLETSTNLVNWTPWPGLQITNGVGNISTDTTNAASKFFRAMQTN